MKSTYADGFSIEVETFDLECRGATRKMDLLFYNTVNRHGDVLTSLVYNSGVKDAVDVTSIHYEPRKLFNNTSFERGYVLNEVSFVWKNLSIRDSFTALTKDNSYNAIKSCGRFNIKTDYAVEYANGEYAYDGWYSLVSVALNELPDISPGIIAGAFRYNEVIGYPQYALIDDPTLPEHWESLQNIDSEIAIYNFLYVDRGESFDSFDFMITVKTRTYYKELLDKKLDGEWFSRMNVLGPKMKTLEASIEQKAFDISQHIIVAINNSLLSLLI